MTDIKTELKLVYRERTWYDFDQRMRTQINSIFNSNANQAIAELKALSPRGVSEPQESLAENWVLQQARRQLISADVAVAIKNTAPDAYNRIVGRPSGLMPPQAPIERWVKNKLLVGENPTKTQVKQTTFLIRRSIALHGTERWRTGENPLGLNKDLTVRAGSPIARMEENILKELEQLKLS